MSVQLVAVRFAKRYSPLESDLVEWVFPSQVSRSGTAGMAAPEGSTTRPSIMVWAVRLARLVASRVSSKVMKGLMEGLLSPFEILCAGEWNAGGLRRVTRIVDDGG